MGKGGGVDIPSEYTTHIDSNGTQFGIDANLDDIRIKELPLNDIHIKEFPKIELGEINVRVKEVPRLTVDSNVAVTQLPPINTNISIKEIPEIKFALTSLPDTRVHLPANFNVGLSVLGVCLINLSLCGEAQIITEKYVPRRMELC
jgi:hypothetical protein